MLTVKASYRCHCTGWSAGWYHGNLSVYWYLKICNLAAIPCVKLVVTGFRCLSWLDEMACSCCFRGRRVLMEPDVAKTVALGADAVAGGTA
jgi:hypothetical protein